VRGDRSRGSPGFLPSASRSVVKLVLSQSHFFTLAGLWAKRLQTPVLFRRRGACLTNAVASFSGTGFQHIATKAIMLNPNFTGSWGVS